MKDLKTFMLAMVMITLSMESLIAATDKSDDTLLEEIIASADSFEVALEKRNYKAAKEQLDIFFPLIKKEMKAAKKQIHELEKNGSKEEAADVEELLTRKTEISDRLHAIVDSSSAGLRVKAKDVMVLVAEYVSLVADKNQLVSVNK